VGSCVYGGGKGRGGGINIILISLANIESFGNYGLPAHLDRIAAKSLPEHIHQIKQSQWRTRKGRGGGGGDKELLVKQVLAMCSLW
jgi:hypothetical protein